MRQKRRRTKPVLDYLTQRRTVETRKVNAEGLRKSLQALLDRGEHPGNEAVAVLSNFRYLASTPEEIFPLLDEVLAKYPYVRQERIHRQK